MLDSNKKRQEVRDKVKASGSKYKYIYSEMKRLGFWKEGDYDFKVIEEYFQKEKDLVSELNKLLVQKRAIQNPDAILKQIHQRRKEESKQKQKETKEKREEERKAKADKWAKSKKEEILFLGEGYSNTLNQTSSDTVKLKNAQLPVLSNSLDLAKAMGISVGELRFLAFSRKNSNISHYKKFTLPKRSGGTRVISAPMPRLKKAQHWILENILNQVPVHESAHGCIKKRSIKTNAQKHLKKEILINQDLQNFFPNITYPRIKGLFIGLGYSHNIATVLSLLCSEPTTQELVVFEETYISQRTERFLPQGSPCSPAITNIICRKLDARLLGLAQKFGFSYTRYVDDISFSAEKASADNASKILQYSKKIIMEEGFILNAKKLRIMRKGSSQHVTGLLVNEKPNINKKTFKKLRAVIYQIEKDGIEGKDWNGRTGEALLASLHGYGSFLNQINPEVGKSYKYRIDVILNKYKYTPANPFAPDQKASFKLSSLFTKAFWFGKKK
ncbi:MAG: reverse transcriptase family protein [Flavobacteriales bacterium]